METWCVYCEELFERRRVTEGHFASHGLNVRWWRGIHGRTIGVQATKANGGVSPGELGCFLSHYTLWQHLCVNGVREALIFEDDVVLAEKFVDRFATCYEHLPRCWQFAYVGWSRPDLELRPVNDHIGVMGYPWGTYAYLLRWEALPVLLDGMNEVRMPVDVQLYEVLPQLRTYCFNPSLVLDRSHLSGEWPTSLA
jgi:GR25 family glycosyltransferase involved in LPS biosynthesis